MCSKHYDGIKPVKKRRIWEIIKDIIVYSILIVSVFMVIFCGIRIFTWIKENEKSNNITKELQSSVSTAGNNKYNIDFKSLKEKNSDTVAWLKVNGTSIEYPVVQTTDNEFYLDHSFDKVKNSAGWLFMDYKNKLSGPGENIVIYGHNRKDGSMFGTLKKILTEEWLGNMNNFTVPFITEKEKAQYQVFSVYKVEKEVYYTTIRFGTSEKFKEFLDTIKSRSIKDFGITPHTDDSILTLSTCADNDKYRVVLHAKKVNSYL